MPQPSDITPTGIERSLAIIIGINDYSQGIPPLSNAVRDANALADTLDRQGFSTLRFLNAGATLASLSRLLSQDLPTLQPAPDRLLIYFAGHGLAQSDDQHQLTGFLLPADARRDDISSYWSMISLREALQGLPCRHLLLILDCCFAGAFPRSSSRDVRPPPQSLPLFFERFRHFSSRRSFQILLSASHNELASDRLLAKPSQEALGGGLHSPFAVALLEALESSSRADSNQDGLLTTSELYTFLRDRLLSLLPPHSPQTPSLWNLDWHEGGEFLFLLQGSFPALPSAAPLYKSSNPYLGLRPFSTAHRHLFFGRERLIDSLLQRLHSQPLLLLSGPSGAGKTSLVQAGLLPRLTKDSWHAPPILRPSSQPLQALSTWLTTFSPDAPSHEELFSKPRCAADFLHTFLTRHPRLSVLLVVDPLEELVTACLDDSLRLTFLRALSCLLQLSHPRLHLLLLLRSDFEPHFLPLLPSSSLPASLWFDSRFPIPTMNREELRHCIQKPAEASVLFFSAALVERLLDDVEQMPGALPLLSVALSELFDAYLESGREDRTFSFDDYQRLGGGIAGALQRRAELVFAGGPPPSSEGDSPWPALTQQELPSFQHTLRNVLLRMVSPEGGELTRHRIPRAELDYPLPEENTRVRHALAMLEACRLIVASDDGGPCVEPAHDALLTAWPRLHDWARQSQRELLLLRRISHAASEWSSHHQSPAFLWADARLDSLELSSTSLHHTSSLLELPTSSSGETGESLVFTTIESAFLRASAAHRRSIRTRRYALAFTVGACLVALMGTALFQFDKANRLSREGKLKELAEASAREALKQQRVAEANAAEALRQRQIAEINALEARRQQEVAETNAREALNQKRAAEASARYARWQQKLAEANAEAGRRQKEAADAYALEAEKQKNLALTNARLFQAQRLLDQDPTKALLVLQETSSQFEESSHTWIEAVLDASQRAISSTILIGHEKRVRKAVLSPDGLRALTASDDGTARLWRVDGSDSPVVLRGHHGAVTAASFSPDGSHLLTASEDGTTRLWRTNGSGAPFVLQGHQGPVTSATFNPDGSLVLSTSTDGTARLWRVGGSDSPILLKGHRQAVLTGAFSPEGARVLTASTDGTARIWHTDGYGASLILKGHKSTVNSAVFSPDGLRVLTASTDGTARIWRADGAGSPTLLVGHRAEVTSATFSPDGSRILTSSLDGTARIWRGDGQGSPTVLQGHVGRLTSATFSPDGSHVLTASADGTARLWRADGSGSPLIFMGHRAEVTSAAFSANDSVILTASADGSARFWRTDRQGILIPLRGPPNQIRDSLKEATTACLASLERERYLLESPDEARKGHSQCERAQGRLP